MKSEAVVIVIQILDLVISTVVKQMGESQSTTKEKSDEVVLVASSDKCEAELWTCTVCSVKIKHKQNIHRHKAICPKVKEVKVSSVKEKTAIILKCDHCEAHFAHQKTITAHMKHNHMEQYLLKNVESVFSCAQCDFKTHADKYLKTHVKKFHMPKGDLICEVCDKKYQNKDSLRVHVKNVHLRGFVCETCGCVIVPTSLHDTHVCEISNPSHDKNATTNNQVSSVSGHQQLNNNSSHVFSTQPITAVHRQQSGQVTYQEPGQHSGFESWNNSQIINFRQSVTEGDKSRNIYHPRTEQYMMQTQAKNGEDLQFSHARSNLDRQNSQVWTREDREDSQDETDVDGIWYHPQTENLEISQEASHHSQFQFSSSGNQWEIVNIGSQNFFNM